MRKPTTPFVLSLLGLLFLSNITPEKKTYMVQIASYYEIVRAVSAGQALEAAVGTTVFIETQWMDSTKRIYRLVAGDHEEMSDAKITLARAQVAGFQDAFVKPKTDLTYIPVAQIKPEAAQHPYNTLGYKEYGIASYYAHEFDKKYTSNGEVYDMDGISAAHNTIQFNSLVRVTNQKNGKQLIVRINDRGPFVKNRILDLSRGAARKLGMVRDGIVPIELEMIRVGADGPRLQSVEAAVSIPNKNLHRTLTYDVWGTPRRTSKYGVQVASYDLLFKAVKLGNELRTKGYQDVFIQEGWTQNHEVTFRVIVGDRAKSLAAGDKLLLEKDYPGCFVKPHFNF
ncbi:MAG: septal ring lytic transglycosylase RlpA family protein [Bernardetiaceae bacterium]